MNYLKNYVDYIDYVKSEVAKGNRPKNKKDYYQNFKGSYFEFHHIIPKCMGGTNDESNLITLTAREHFLAHYLLTKIYPENTKLKMAFIFFSRTGDKDSRKVVYVNSRLYEKVRKETDWGATSRGKKRPKEFGEKISKAQKGRHLGEIWRQHVIESHADFSGEKNPMYKKHHTEESRKKMSESQRKCFDEERRKRISERAKRLYKGDGNPRAKTVRCIETNEIFTTTLEAARKYGAENSKSRISAVCKGKAKTAFGYHWEYV